MNPHPQRFTVQAIALAGSLLVMLALISYCFFRGSRDWGFFLGVAAIAGVIALKALSSRRMRLDEMPALVGRPRLTVGVVGLLTMFARAVFGGIAIYRRFFCESSHTPATMRCSEAFARGHSHRVAVAIHGSRRPCRCGSTR
jgi:hypothetical protein